MEIKSKQTFEPCQKSWMCSRGALREVPATTGTDKTLGLFYRPVSHSSPPFSCESGRTCRATFSTVWRIRPRPSLRWWRCLSTSRWPFGCLCSGGTRRRTGGHVCELPPSASPRFFPCCFRGKIRKCTRNERTNHSRFQSAPRHSRSFVFSGFFPRPF